MSDIIKKQINYITFNYAKYSNLFPNFEFIDIGNLHILFYSLLTRGLATDFDCLFLGISKIDQVF